MRFRCNLCGDFPRMLEFEDNGGECPRCGARGPPLVAPLIDVHLMVMDRKGPIRGRQGGQYVACQPTRPYLCRTPEEMFSATGEAGPVTCPRCLMTKQFAEAAALAELPVAEGPGRATVDMGAKG